MEFPLPGGTLSEYPVRVYVYRATEGPKLAHRRRITICLSSRKSECERTPVLVEYMFDSQKARVNVTLGRQAMDVDGDGEIDTSITSPEYLFANNETLIFKIGDVYLSTENIDLTRYEVTLVTRDSSEYQTIALKPGTAVPDFQFTDFGGQHRRLSDFAGKLVLLDFWASWCHPCVSDLPNVKNAYDELRNRGLVVIGMNVDEDVAKARDMIARQRLDYPQAIFASIRELEEKRFRIRAFPTYVLVDPDRQILAVEFSGEKTVAGLEHWLSLEPQRTSGP